MVTHDVISSDFSSHFMIILSHAGLHSKHFYLDTFPHLPILLLGMLFRHGCAKYMFAGTTWADNSPPDSFRINSQLYFVKWNATEWQVSWNSWNVQHLLDSPLSITWIPWNLSFRYIHCTGQFTPKMKANAEPPLLSSLVWVASGVVVSQHRLEPNKM